MAGDVTPRCSAAAAAVPVDPPLARPVVKLVTLGVMLPLARLLLLCCRSLMKRKERKSLR
jgi:hypothetical protein